MKALAQTFLRIELDKTTAMSSWEKYPLTFTQIKYAALDAWIGLKIFQKLKHQQFSQERESGKSRFRLIVMFILFSYTCI